ncbi:MAG TPA: hypothetical protein VN725_04860 [Rhodanobacteraceae bacterium]|nr:hypothetical protein [Rhodanobacteraceae bacterium]
MELDEMKLAWQQMNRKLDALQTMNANLGAERKAGRARRTMLRARALIWSETIIAGLTLLALGGFIWDQTAMRFMVPALILYPVAIAVFASGIRQLMLASRIDFSEPVLEIQRQLESLRGLRLRTTQMEFLWMLLLWVPVAIVIARCVGVDLYAAMGAPWMAWNVALGVAAVPCLLWLARRFAPAFNRSSIGRTLIDQLTGQGLAATREQVAAIARFERE